MFAIFFRTYLYMMATIFSGLLVFFLLLLPVLQSFEKEDDLRLVRGTVQLLVNELAASDTDQWPARVQQFRAEFGPLLSLEPLEQVALPGDAGKDLLAGALVSIYEEDIFYQRLVESEVVLRLRPPLDGSPWFLEKKSPLADLTISLLLRSLKGVSEEQWPASVDRINGWFGFPLQIKELGTISLSEESSAELRQGGRLIDLGEEIVYQPIEGSGYILCLGPVFQNQHWILKILFYLLLALFLLTCGCAALLWARPLWKDMDRLSSAAIALGSGDFSSRARLARKSDLKSVAEVFNSMALRLQLTVGSQKDLINGVAHELRTPIMRMRLLAELLAPQLEEKQEACALLCELRDNMDELDDLTSEILAYLKLEQIARTFGAELVMARPWLDRLLAGFELSLQRGGLRLEVELETDSAVILLDPKMMARALSNLINNAIKHARHRVRLSLISKNGRYSLLVDDDGPGIAAEDRERIFQPFTRLEPQGEGSRGLTGYGLGLSIVRRIAEWHNGRVTAETSPLGGARLKICWSGSDNEGYLPVTRPL
ncbi:ATP-binding protein [Desulfogranum mediterraneum]|uniref:ATP-binding protein n=1 Tax=Desulfogranum mediterraneum TaxID=160661 RepID=UPI000427ACEC|nr:ATP-binding protein [Desulfogranum mediterraneum]